MINASKHFEKGRPKNFVSEVLVLDLWNSLRVEDRGGISKVVNLEEIARNDYNLSPSRYVFGTEERIPSPSKMRSSYLKKLKSKELRRSIK